MAVDDWGIGDWGIGDWEIEDWEIGDWRLETGDWRLGFDGDWCLIENCCMMGTMYDWNTRLQCTLAWLHSNLILAQVVLVLLLQPLFALSC